MDTAKSSVAEQKLTVGDGLVGMLNVFVDPKATARRVPAPLSWLWPLITLFVVSMVFGYLMMPYITQAFDVRLRQANVAPEQFERVQTIYHVVAQLIPVIGPVTVLIGLLLLAWLVGLTGSMVGMRVKFRDLFALIAACWLVQVLQTIAIYIVLRTKGDEITSQDQLTPPFGLDIALQNVHGALGAVLNFFSIFEIWFLVVLTIGLAYLAKTTKGKAFFAITVAWLVPLLVRIIQGMFQPATTG